SIAESGERVDDGMHLRVTEVAAQTTHEARVLRRDARLAQERHVGERLVQHVRDAELGRAEQILVSDWAAGGEEERKVCRGGRAGVLAWAATVESARAPGSATPSCDAFSCQRTCRGTAAHAAPPRESWTTA